MRKPLREKRPFEVIESRQMEHLRVFNDVARTLTSSLELEVILSAIMEKMALFFGPERWSLLMVDEATQELFYAIAVGENLETLKGLRIAMGEGVAGWVASTGNPLIVPNVRLDPHWAAFARNHPELNIQSLACLPIRCENRTLGVIQLLNSELDLLSEYSISFLRILCDYAAIAIRNAHSMRRVHELTILDDCTGLFNSRHLYQQLDLQVAAAGVPPRQTFSLLFLDLDHFKMINDVHGHQRGTRVLAEVGSLLQRFLGAANPAFRYGGDEFVAILPKVSKADAMAEAVGLCEELRGTRFLQEDGLSLCVTGSFGLATFPEDGDSVQSILRAADMAMYEAKQNTRNNVAVAGYGLVMDVPVSGSERRNPLRLAEEGRRVFLS